MDVWHVDSDGSVQFRVRSEEFQKMKGDLPECSEKRNVEELLREVERRELNKTQQDDWFERYVRQTDRHRLILEDKLFFSPKA